MAAAVLALFKSKASIFFIVLLVLLPTLLIDAMKKETFRADNPGLVGLADFLQIVLPALVGGAMGIALFRWLGNTILAMLAVVVTTALLMWWGAIP